MSQENLPTQTNTANNVNHDTNINQRIVSSYPSTQQRQGFVMPQQVMPIPMQMPIQYMTPTYMPFYAMPQMPQMPYSMVPQQQQPVISERRAVEKEDEKVNTLSQRSLKSSPSKSVSSIASSTYSKNFSQEVKDIFWSYLDEILLELVFGELEEKAEESSRHKFISQSYEKVLAEILKKAMPRLVRESMEEVNNEFINYQNMDFYEIYGAGEGTAMDLYKNYKKRRKRAFKFHGTKDEDFLSNLTTQVSVELASKITFCFDKLLESILEKMVRQSVDELTTSFLYYKSMKLDGFGSDITAESYPDVEFPRLNDSLNSIISVQDLKNQLEQDIALLKNEIQLEDEDDTIQMYVEKLEKEKIDIYGMKLGELENIAKVQWSGFGASARSFRETEKKFNHHKFFDHMVWNGFGSEEENPDI